MAKVRALAQGNMFGPRYATASGQPPRWGEACNPQSSNGQVQLRGWAGWLMKARTEGEPRATRGASPVSFCPLSGVGQRSMGNHNYAIGRSEVAERFVVARKRVKARGAKEGRGVTVGQRALDPEVFLERFVAGMAAFEEGTHLERLAKVRFLTLPKSSRQDSRKRTAGGELRWGTMSTYMTSRNTE